MTKTKRQTKKGRPMPAPALPPLEKGEVADEGIFRSDLRRLEQNNLKFFGGNNDDIEIKKKEN